MAVQFSHRVFGVTRCAIVAWVCQPVLADPPAPTTQPSRQITQVIVRYDDGTEQTLAAANPASPGPVPPPSSQPAQKLPNEAISYGVPMAGGTLHVNALAIPQVAADPLNTRCEWDFGDARPTSRYSVLPGW